MIEQKKYIDIGGGTYPDYFLTLSRIDRNSHYFVLDPTIRSIPEKPENLHFIKWQFDSRSVLPFADNSIHGIYMNYLYDELRTDGILLDWSDPDAIFENGYNNSPDINNENLQSELYLQLLHSVRRVMHQNGIVTILDTNENARVIVDMCLSEGFHLGTEPSLVSNPAKSAWTRWFYDIYISLDPDEGKNDVAPTEFSLCLY